MLALSFRSIVKQQLLDRLILDRVRHFGYVAERHGSLRNWVLILRGIVQINHVIVGVIRHKLQSLGNRNASDSCCARFRALAPREHGESWRRLRVTECGARFSFRSPKELQRSSRDEFRLVFRNEMATIWHKLNF